MRLRRHSICILTGVFLSAFFLFFFSGICWSGAGYYHHDSVDKLLNNALGQVYDDGAVDLGLRACSSTPGAAVEDSYEKLSAQPFQWTGSISQLPDSSVLNFQDQGPDLDWERRYAGPADETIWFAQQTSDGGYIMAGDTFSPGNNSSDAYLIKTDASGNIVWKNIYGGSADDSGCCVREIPGGGYVLAGSTELSGSGGYDFYLVRTDASGNILWEKTYGGLKNDYGRSVWVNSDGTMLIAGETYSYGAGGADIYLVKVDATGAKLWDRCIGGSDNDWAVSIQAISDGIIIAGGTESYGAGKTDAFLIKADLSGNKLWHRTFGGPEEDLAFSVQQTAEGGFILAGSTASFGEGGVDVFLVKTDSSGNRQWEQYFGGESDDWAFSVQQTADGGYILGGSSLSFGLGDSECYLVKTGASGVPVWEKTRGGGGNSLGNWAIQTMDGGFVLAGETNSTTDGLSDGWLIKYKAEDVTGDMNEDYIVDILDLLWMSQYIGPVKCPSSQKADFNCDGQVNVLDLLQVHNLIGQGPVLKELLIYDLSPGSGPAGTPVEITGRGFGSTQGASTVTFNGLNASVTSWSDTRIKTEVPPGATSGMVVVTVGGKASNGVKFEVTTGNEAVLESQTGIIGPDGGAISLPDGTCLTVPPGALGAETSLTLCKIENERNFGGPYWRAYEIRGAFEPLPAVLAVPLQDGPDLKQIGVLYYNPESLEGVRPPFEYYPLSGNVVISLLDSAAAFESLQFCGQSLAPDGNQGREELFPGYRVIVEVGSRSAAPCNEKKINMPFYQQVAGTSWAADAAMLSKAYTPYTDRSTEIELYNYLKCAGSGLTNSISPWDFKHRLNHCFHSFTGVNARTYNWLVPDNLKVFMRDKIDEGHPLILRYSGYSLLILGYRDYQQGAQRVLDFYVHDSRGADPPSGSDGTMYTWRSYQNWLVPRLTAEPVAINSVLWAYDNPPHPGRALQTLGLPSMDQPGELRFEYKNEYGAVVKVRLGFSESEPKGYAWYIGPSENRTRVDLIPAQAELRLALNVWNADLGGSATTDIEVKIFQEGNADPVYSGSGSVTAGVDRSPALFVHNVPSCEFKSNSNVVNYTLQVELYNSGIYQDGFAVDFVLDDGPVICSVSPDSGNTGSQITINGFGFAAVQDISAVTFNGVPAEEIISWSPASIVVKVPETASSGDLRVTVNGKVSNGVRFEVRNSN